MIKDESLINRVLPWSTSGYCTNQVLELIGNSKMQPHLMSYQ